MDRPPEGPTSLSPRCRAERIWLMPTEDCGWPETETNWRRETSTRAWPTPSLLSRRFNICRAEGQLHFQTPSPVWRSFHRLEPATTGRCWSSEEPILRL